ncbi:MAG: hypothetical protein GKR91_00110 [Pseudomonadales bacterium]|nr:hypothetical protein [Pseudomonadales bacterium]
MEAIPRSIFSRDFEILENSKKIADIDMSAWRERAEVLIDNTTYNIKKEGFLNPTFSLVHNGKTLVTASREMMLRRQFVIDIAGARYYLKNKNWLARAMILTNDISRVGLIKPRNFFGRGAKVDLPGEIELPVQVFIVWLVLLLWKRDSNAAASGSGN